MSDTQCATTDQIIEALPILFICFFGPLFLFAIYFISTTCYENKKIKKSNLRLKEYTDFVLNCAERSSFPQQDNTPEFKMDFENFRFHHNRFEIVNFFKKHFSRSDGKFKKDEKSVVLVQNFMKDDLFGAKQYFLKTIRTMTSRDKIVEFKKIVKELHPDGRLVNRFDVFEKIFDALNTLQTPKEIWNGLEFIFKDNITTEEIERWFLPYNDLINPQAVVFAAY